MTSEQAFPEGRRRLRPPSGRRLGATGVAIDEPKARSERGPASAPPIAGGRRD
jgi:hypothetical protein